MPITATLAEILDEGLTTQDRDLACAATNPHRQLEIRCGRGLLRRTLHLCANAEIARRPLQTGPHGQPYIADSHIHFSITHSQQLPGKQRPGQPAYGQPRLLLALAHGASVGIDVERSDRTLPLDKMANKILSPSEQALFDQLPGNIKRIAFFIAWTGKEAVLKAIGTGVHGVPARAQLLGSTNAPSYLDAKGVRHRYQAWWLPMSEPYIACVVATPNMSAPRLLAIDPAPC